MQKNSYKRLKNICLELKDDKKQNKKYLGSFKKVVEDDLDIPKALQVLWSLLRDEKANGKYQTVKEMDEVFGLKLLEKEKFDVPKKVIGLVKEREIARREKNWKKSDELRDEIKKLGFSVDDTNEGSVVRKI